MFTIPSACVTRLLNKSFPFCEKSSTEAGSLLPGDKYNLKLLVVGLGYTSAMGPPFAFSLVMVSIASPVDAPTASFPQVALVLNSASALVNPKLSSQLMMAIFVAEKFRKDTACLLYTSDAADEEDS